MESTAKLRKWILVGLGVGAVVSALLGALPICDYGKGLAVNLATELAGGLVTYLLLELVLRRREESEAKEKELAVKKAALIAQMGSSVKDVAIAAAEELRRCGWLTDGSLQGASLVRANLQGADLDEADLAEAFLSGASLMGASLIGANLSRAWLIGTDLEGAMLSLANLKETLLWEANLEGTRLIETNLEGADLQRANLEGAYLVGANPQGTKLDENTTLPDGTKWTPATDMARFTDSKHPDFWSPDA